MHQPFRQRRLDEPIRIIHGTASFAGGLFKDHFPKTDEVVAVLKALIRANPGSEPIELEGAYLYGWGHEQLVLGRALDQLEASERARFGYVTKVGRILVTAKPGLRSGQPPGIWPPGATEGLRRESWGFGENDTDVVLAASTLLVGQDFSAAYLHDPPDCMAELGLTFDEWWDRVNGRAAEQGGGVMGALVKARANGILAEIGVGVKEVDILELLLKADPDVWDRFSVTRYSLMSQAPLLDFLARQNQPTRSREGHIKLIAAGPYAGGILSRDPRGARPEEVFCNYRQATSQEVKVGCALWDLAAKHGLSSPMPAAIQFVAKQSALWGMVLGPRTPEDVTTNAQYLEQTIPLKFWTELWNLKVEGEWVVDRRVQL